MPKPAYVGEHCPRHGTYPRPHHADQLRDQATQPGMPAPQARALLDRYGMERRVCPDCGGKAPSQQEWAIEARFRCRLRTPTHGVREPVEGARG